MTVATSSTLRVRETDHTSRLSQQRSLMVLHASPRIRVKTNLAHPIAKAQKGFLSRLFSCSPQVPVKTVVRRPSAPKAPSHTGREPPGQNLSRRQPAPPTPMQDPPERAASPNSGSPRCKSTMQDHSERGASLNSGSPRCKSIMQDPPERGASLNSGSPRCKSIKDNLHELGLTIPVVLTQPQVAGSEAVLPRVDKAVSLHMLFSGVRSELSKTSRTTSSQPTPGSSRGQVHTIPDYAPNSEQPVLDITHDDGRFAHLATSTSSLLGSSLGQASRVAVVEKFEEVALSTPHKKVPSSVQNDRVPSSKISPIPTSTSAPSSPSTHSMHNHTPSSNCSKRQRKSPSVDSGQMTVTSERSQRHVPAEPASLFPIDEGLFGRPKPPPPLKIVPKKIKKQKDSVPVPPLPTTRSHEHLPTRASHTRSKTVSQIPISGYFHIFDRSDSTLPLLRSDSTPELPALAPAPVHIKASKEQSLSRTSTLMTVASDQTQASSTSVPELPQNTKWTWTPPADWSGPSSTRSTESGDNTPSGKKPVFLAHLRRAKSSSKPVVSAAKLRSSYHDTSSTTPAHSAMTKRDDKGHVPPTPKKRDSYGVIVKVQGFQGDDLKEAPLHDVIPRLRKLKSSVL